jgi:hypothetical protein
LKIYVEQKKYVGLLGYPTQTNITAKDINLVSAIQPKKTIIVLGLCRAAGDVQVHENQNMFVCEVARIMFFSLNKTCALLAPLCTVLFGKCKCDTGTHGSCYYVEFFFFGETRHFIDHMTSIQRVFWIYSGAKLEIKPLLDTSQVLARMCAASLRSD